jgi:hypothetical protein
MVDSIFNNIASQVFGAHFMVYGYRTVDMKFIQGSFPVYLKFKRGFTVPELVPVHNYLI